MARRIKLLEVFEDFEIYVKGGSQYGRYDAWFKVVPRKDRKRIELKDLEEYIKNLQKRFPKKNFYLGKRKINGKTFYIITKKSYYIDNNGRKRKIRDRVPIYADLEEQKFYVPASYVKKMPKLVNYICMVTLGALGVSQSVYIRSMGRA